MGKRLLFLLPICISFAFFVLFFISLDKGEKMVYNEEK